MAGRARPDDAQTMRELIAAPSWLTVIQLLAYAFELNRSRRLVES
jgi:hypothetical protein